MNTQAPQSSRFSFYAFLFPLLLALLLTACRGAEAETPTPGLNLTQAYETVIAQVTQIAAQTALPTGTTPPPTESGLPTFTPTPEFSATPGIPTGIASTFTPTPTPESSTCDRAEAAFPIDITIPDDTEFDPGTAFVKTWRLVNVGTCTWTSGYSLVFFSGEKMSGPDVSPIGADVAPNQTVDISVNLIAPSDPGSYQGNWMLRNADGVLFGVGPQFNSFFWVRIVVLGGPGTPTVTPGGSATVTTTPSGSETPTPTSTTTPTPTESATPVILVNSSIAFQPDGFVDLDTGTTNGASGNDITYTTDPGGTHPITPVGGATIGVFGSQMPTFANCQSASLSSASLAVESLSIGTYLCYRTEPGNYGWLRIDGFDANDFLLSLTLLTWD